MKIKLHSVTDLITNSSTVIFTYSDGCVKPLKEMFNEILKTFGIEKTFDEMFDTVVLMDEVYHYEDYFSEKFEEEDLPQGMEKPDFNQL